MRDVKTLIRLGAVITLLVIALFAGLMFGMPSYRVWSQGMQGKANLRQAEQEKMIMIETAKAEKEAAVQRAEAIRIMGEAAKEFPE